jgi:hypothetical protein
MAADDLGAPLSRRGLIGRLRDMRISALRAAVTVILCALAGLFVWLGYNSDPLGGEPVVVLRIKDAPAATGNAVVPGDLGMRTGLRHEDPTADTAERGRETAAERMASATQDAADAQSETSTSGLGPAPQKGLSEAGRFGPLPRIAADGRRPSQVYARPVPAPDGSIGKQPRIAILIGGMGLSTSGTNEAIAQLPPSVSLAFAPYPKDLQEFVTKARRHGHEVLLQIPMEPFDYPSNDPGPYTLLTDLSPKENIQRLDWLMSRFTGYFGVTNYMGAKFTSTADALRPALKQLSARGLVYIDDGASARSHARDIADEVGLGNATADALIDADQTPEAIDQALGKLEQVARERGFALGVGSGLPVTIERVTEWARTLADKDILLVPASAAIPAGQT